MCQQTQNTPINGMFLTTLGKAYLIMLSKVINENDFIPIPLSIKLFRLNRKTSVYKIDGLHQILVE